MKTIYLHIGKHKTGTTSIQYMLSQNQQKFEEMAYKCICDYDFYRMFGVSYTQPNHPFSCPSFAHLFLRDDLMTPMRIRHGNKFANFDKYGSICILRELLWKIREDNIIISAEAFSFCRESSELQYLMKAFDKFDIQIVVCLREASAWMKSWQAQTRALYDFCLKNGIESEIFDYSESSWLVDDQNILKFWQQLGNVRVLNYEEEMEFYDNIIPPFLISLGIHNPHTFIMNNVKLNITS